MYFASRIGVVPDILVLLLRVQAIFFQRLDFFGFKNQNTRGPKGFNGTDLSRHYLV